MQVWLFIPIKKKKNTLHGPLNAIMRFLVFYPRGSAAIDIVSISNISEFHLSGGVGIFQKFLKLKKFWIIRGGVQPDGEFSPNFPVFFSDASPNIV